MEEGGAGVGAAGKKIRQVQALQERKRGRCKQKEEGGLQYIGEVTGRFYMSPDVSPLSP